MHRGQTRGRAQPPDPAFGHDVSGAVDKSRPHRQTCRRRSAATPARMELFRRVDNTDRVRAVALPADVPMDVHVTTRVVDQPVLQMASPEEAAELPAPRRTASRQAAERRLAITAEQRVRWPRPRRGAARRRQRSVAEWSWEFSDVVVTGGFHPRSGPSEAAVSVRIWT